MSKIILAVAHHKEYYTFSNKIFQPIHVGKVLSELNLGFADDEEGDNISNLNPYYCEMTAIYWIWKNVDADFYGLNHYRRYFTENKRVIPTLSHIKHLIKREFKIKKKSMFWDNFIINQNKEAIISDILNKTSQSLKNDLKSNQMIIPNKCFFINNTVADFFTEQLNKRHVISLKEIVRNDFKHFYNILINSLENNYLYPANIFVFNRDIFHEYCELMFDILDKHYKNELLLNNNLDDYSRISGYMAELITNAFIQKKISENIEYKEYNVLYIK